MRTSRGFRKGTRNRLRNPLRMKFKPTLFIRDFKIGDIVIIDQNAISQKGMPHPRFKSVTGEVTEKRGNAYMVRVNTGKAQKQILANAEHLRKTGK